jgi:hypothetical protein
MELQFSLDSGKLIIKKDGEEVDTKHSLLSFIRWTERETPLNKKELKIMEEISGIKIPEFYLQFIQLTSGDNPEVVDHPGETVCFSSATVMGGRFEQHPIMEGITDIQDYSTMFVSEFAYFYNHEDDSDHDLTASTLKLLPLYFINGSAMCLDFSESATDPKVVCADTAEPDVFPAANNFLDFLLHLEII